MCVVIGAAWLLINYPLDLCLMCVVDVMHVALRNVLFVFRHVLFFFFIFFSLVFILYFFDFGSFALVSFWTFFLRTVKFF